MGFAMENIHQTPPPALQPEAPEQAGAEQVLQLGVPGLDDVLGGGLTAERLYLLEGSPGTGKTTIAMQFLFEGRRRGESMLYVTLSETIGELRGVARSHGWDLAGIHVRELLPSAEALEPDENYTIFHPSEVELGETTLKILSEVDQIKPSRVVFDSLSELRLLAGNSLRYRRQILALKQFFAGRQCTVLLLDDMTAMEHDLQVQSIAHAVIRLESLSVDYGTARRRLMVCKYRGRQFRGGFHDYKILRGGLQVFPRLVAAEHPMPASQQRLASGLPALDELLGGGIEEGTSTLLLGAPGTGKSSLAVHFALAAAERGQAAALFIFDESSQTLRSRAAGMGMDLAPQIAAGRITVRQVDPAELSPGEFVDAIRRSVEQDRVKVVVIDSLNGYLNAMPDERFLIAQLHELLTYLGQASVATLLVGAQHGLIGMQMQTPVDASYLADGVVLLRYFEHAGEVRQAISVLKKRGGAHERSIREFSLTAQGVRVGEPLRHFRGILTGVPTPTNGTPPSQS
ncbi:ATPase domain-containing protein [Roseateles violae]|uniref:non-specific serine/threonine protein kinase n=1 Tax=Roseateles violae TaxID=3058042 RepID=A0ABT8DM44_9BURK|nr:ATPase domain-containing protein [Pelomonas sp. PFR6]MDN3919481.1 ATPase domain-containing protein [Pelomonas sp. PFR6]